MYGVGPDRLRVIPRGVDLAVFDPARVERRAGHRPGPRNGGCPTARQVVMLPGRLTRWKGGLDFIEAIAALGRRDICAVCWSAPSSDRASAASSRRRSSGWGSAGMFRIIEDCRDMPAAYMLSDVVVSASNEPEGFGRVIIEAQAMGRPVVATDHGGARETIVPGVTGWLAPPGDPAALAAAIGEALAARRRSARRLGRTSGRPMSLPISPVRRCAPTPSTVYEELLFSKWGRVDAAAQ